MVFFQFQPPEALFNDRLSYKLITLTFQFFFNQYDFLHIVISQTIKLQTALAVQ